jgi:hypothetical protein
MPGPHSPLLALHGYTVGPSTRVVFVSRPQSVVVLLLSLAGAFAFGMVTNRTTELLVVVTLGVLLILASPELRVLAVEDDAFVIITRGGPRAPR